MSVLSKTREHFSIFGGLLIILFYILKGRYPLRVYQTVFIAQIWLLLVIRFSNPCRIRVRNIAKRVFDYQIIILLCIGMAYSLISADYHMPQFALVSQMNIDDSSYEETYIDDHIYLWQSWHYNVSYKMMKKGKLLSKRILDHNISIGDWTYGQQYYNDYLKQLGISNPIKSLIEEENVFLVAEKPTLHIAYIKEQYGESFDLVRVGEIADVPCYQCIRDCAVD